MVEKIVLKARHISEIDFSPFGDVLDPDRVEEKIRPTDGVEVTPHIGKIEIKNGEPEFTHLKASQRGYTVTFLERHLLTSQSFIPLNGCVGLFVLCPPGDQTPGVLPDLERAVAVIYDGAQGLNLRLGCWHTAPIPLSEVSNYVMVTRKGTLKDDLHLVDLKEKMNKYFEIVL